MKFRESEWQLGIAKGNQKDDSNNTINREFEVQGIF